MFLKELQIKGFKSFLNTTKMSFYNGVTAIVGPNGSGKSNISDAIRWALGETSIKNLRGSKMEDVIFTGTELHKPVGFAEVEITFGDCNIPSLPYDEVTVTRRMYRDGESEYYLNRNKVRLKDVREAFMDTGIGRDGYSLIGQGQIDEVLSTKPEDRRFIFEEASGISKFRFKKDEAIGKIKKCEDDILRLKDILNEINSQYSRLEKESIKAKEYTDLAVIQNELGLDFLYLNLSKNFTDKESIERETTILADELINLKNKIKDRTKEEGGYEKLIEECNHKYEDINEKKLIAIKEFSEVKGEYRLNLEKESMFKNELIDLESRLKALNDESESLGKKISLIRSNMDECGDDEENELKKILNSAILKREQLEKEYSILRENVMKKLTDYSKNESEFIVSSQKREMLESRIKESVEQTEDLSYKSKGLSIELEGLEFKIDEISSTFTEIENRKIILNNKVAEREAYRNSIKKFIEELESEIKSAKYKRDLKVNLIRQNELTNYANKRIFSQFKNHKGYLGDIYKNIEVDKQYTKAVEIALGQKLNYIVTKDEQDAKIMIEFLKSEKAGRATFLPLERYKKVNNWPKLKTSSNLLGYLADFIETKKEYRALVDNLIGPIVLFKDLESALLERSRLGKTIVTLDGEVLHFSGSITGGEKAKSQITPLSVKNDIIELDKLIAQDELNLKAKVNELSGVNIDTFNDELRALEDELNHKRQEVVNLKNLYLVAKERYEAYSKTITNNRENEKRWREELLSFKVINYDTSEYSKSEEEFKIFEEKYIKEKSELDIIISNSQDKLKELNIKDIERTAARKTLFELVERNDRLNQEVKESKTKLVKANENLKEVRESNIRLLERMKVEESRERTFDDSINELVFERDELKEKVRLNRIEKEELQLSASKLETKINSYEIKIARIEENIVLNREKLNSQFDLNLEDFMLSNRKTKTLKEVSRELNDVNEKIESMGNVNLSALGQFEECKERKGFYEVQIEDINKSISDLQLVVDEINRDMRRQFRLAFGEIRKNFQEVFETLFNGGYADLQLEDENNILNSGINIIAKPPGKKEQALSLLSGGEKTLTAMALLFAFLKLKPSPFCILDEIDAALDDANIRRYTKFLSELSRDSQFLVITHRKTTLEVADTIYGVCMPNKGVSEIISMRFDEYEEAEA